VQMRTSAHQNICILVKNASSGISFGFITQLKQAY